MFTDMMEECPVASYSLLKSIANMQWNERWGNLRKATDDFHWPFYLYVYTSLTSIQQLQQTAYQVIVLWMSLPETIKQKDSMGIIGNDMRI